MTIFVRIIKETVKSRGLVGGGVGNVGVPNLDGFPVPENVDGIKFTGFHGSRVNPNDSHQFLQKPGFKRKFSGTNLLVTLKKKN